MKRITCMLIAITATIAAASATDEFTTDASKLPEAARTYIAKNFPSAKIAGIKIDREMTLVEDYKVIFSDGTKAEFLPSGELKEIENKSAGIPTNLLPKAAADYIAKNYSSIKAVKFEIQHYGFEIELANGLELKFSRDGKLLEVDA